MADKPEKTKIRICQVELDLHVSKETAKQIVSYLKVKGHDVEVKK